MADGTNINTHGGGYVEGSASAGNDFVGRDNVTYNYNLDQLDTDQTVKVIARRLLGSELHGVKGIVGELREINHKLELISMEQGKGQQQRDNMESRIQNLSWRLNWLMIVISLLAIVEIILLVRVFGG
jgi:hypothetical protein